MEKIVCYECGRVLGRARHVDRCAICEACFNAPVDQGDEAFVDEEMLNTIKSWWFTLKKEGYDSPEDKATYIKIMSRIIALTGIEYELDD